MSRTASPRPECSSKIDRTRVPIPPPPVRDHRHHLHAWLIAANVSSVATVAQVRPIHNEPFALFLALQREISSGMPWELCLLQRPHGPVVGAFAEGLRAVRAAGATSLPLALAQADDITDFVAGCDAADDDSGRGWATVRRSLVTLADELRAAIELHAPPTLEAVEELDAALRRDQPAWLGVLTRALGVRPLDEPFPVYLVPFAPCPPGTAFLTVDGATRAGYVDHRRYGGAVSVECALTLLSWQMLTSVPSDEPLTRLLGQPATGDDRTVRRLRAIVLKALVAMVAEHAVKFIEPDYRGTIVTFGLDLRFPRVLAAVREPWESFLQGRTSRPRAMAAIDAALAERPASWFLEQVDAASLAADFYLLEWLTSQGDPEATAVLAAWQPRLATDFVRHLDFAIGAELAHYDAIPLGTLEPTLKEFVRGTCEENSLIRWPAARRAAGADAYRMSREAFLGPGLEYGGEAWAPVARLMAEQSDGAVPERVFIDQCFTLEHNNGCLFDKFFDTWDMQATLQAQARGDLATLAGRASAQTRQLFSRHRERPLASTTPAAPERLATSSVAVAPAMTSARWWPAPGMIGCGSNVEPGDTVSRAPDGSARPMFRGTIRKSHAREVPPFRSVVATLHTDLGPVVLALSPGDAPMAVGTFVQLARGEVAWRDPATGTTTTGPFYDGTRFHRLEPGFIIQAGDRTETGRGGPGFRYDEEPSTGRFDRPYLVGMVNTGIVTNGSQFFVTLAPAPHLDGQYTIIGQLADDSSADVAHRIADAGGQAGSDVRIRRVLVDAE